MPRNPFDAVCHAVSLYDRGIICPAEMWFQVVRVLSAESVPSILDSLPVTTLNRLIKIYEERPSLPQDEFRGVVDALRSRLQQW